MARFTLVVQPDGKAMLTTNETIPAHVVPALRAAFEDWQKGHPLIVAECDVVQVVEIELDLPSEVPA